MQLLRFATQFSEGSHKIKGILQKEIESDAKIKTEFEKINDSEEKIIL